MSTRRLLLTGCAVALLSLGAVSAAVVARGSRSSATITVTERDYSIGLSRRSSPRGRVRLIVRNLGAIPHELAVQGPGVAKRTALIRPGTSAALVVDLRAGAYVLSCPLPGHAAKGMRTVLKAGVPGQSGGTTTGTSSTTPSTTSTDPIPGY